MKFPKKNKPIKYIRDRIEQFTKNAAGSNLSQIQAWLNDCNILEKFYANLKKEQFLYTLLSPEKVKNINKFFHPPRLRSSEDQEVYMSSLLNNNTGVLIQGRLGQGKSVLLKQLQFIELNTGKSIPVFLELRKIKQANQIEEKACHKLESLGLECSRKLFKFLLQKGHISFFLDGFDELPLESRKEFNDALFDLRTSYPESKIIVTSRFNTELSKNTKFEQFNISPLNRDELAPFIKKILGNSELSNPILSKIAESNEFDFDVLDTPLMITWFIVVYNKRLKIPKTQIGFYEDLFSAILARHDGFKGSYNRPTKSKLSDDEIKSVLCLLCYLSRKDEKGVFTENEIKKYIRRALNVSDLQYISPENFLYDLTHVTCLLKQDGLDYEFIHESVVQYFSSLFLSKATEENSEEFYTNRLSDWKRMEGELHFLMQIDEVRYYKYFHIPKLEELLDKNAKGYFIKSSAISDIFQNSVIVNREISDSENFQSNTHFILLPPENYVFRTHRDEKFISRVRTSVNKFIRDDNRLEYLREHFSSDNAFHDPDFSLVHFFLYLDDEGVFRKFYSHVQNIFYNEIDTALKKAKVIVERETAKKGLYS